MEEVDYSEILKTLKSDKSSVIYNMLVEIRKKYSKNSKILKAFIKTNIIKEIILLIDHPKFCTICLSILADACLNKSIVYEVIYNNGIESLIRIMKSLLNEETKNRACRALGNIAKCDTGFNIISKMNLIPHVVHFLKDTTDEYCQQTAVRTLRILGKNREVASDENVVISISKLLHSSSKEVLLCSIRALAELTEKCVNNACQLSESSCIEKLVELHSHSIEEVKVNSLTTLKNLSDVDKMRSDLIKYGALKLFTDIVLNSESLELTKTASYALCNLVEYIPMWNHYGVTRHIGLKAVIKPLRQSKFETIHDSILGTILPLCLESDNSEIMVDLEVINTLIELLKVFITRYKVDHTLDLKSVQSINTSEDFIIPTSEKELFVEEENCNSSDGLDSTIAQTSLDEIIDSRNQVNSDVLSEFSPFNNSFTLVKAPPKVENQYFPHTHFRNACSPSSSGYNTATSPHLSSDYSASSPLGGDPLSPYSNFHFYDGCLSPVYSTSGSDTCDNISESFSTSMTTLNDTVSESTCGAEIVPNNKPESSLASESLIPTELSETLGCTNKEKDTVSLVDKFLSSNKRKAENQEISENTKKICYSETSESLQKKRNSALPVRVSSIDICLLTILEYLFFHCKNRTNSEFAGKTCFSIIMDYINMIEKPCDRAEKLLLNIIENRYYFEKLILNGFVAELEKRISTVHDVNICIRCSEKNDTYLKLLVALRKEAESDYGVGTLCHILITGEKSSQMCAVYAASKLVVLQSAIYKLINKGNVLAVLLKFVSDDSEAVRSDAILSLYYLYQNLLKSKVKDERCCFNGTCNAEVSSGCPYRDALTDVVFDVGGVNVSACRNTICSNSEYFNALLKGHFSESQKEVIIMAEISAETLTMIFHFLHGCKTKTSCRYIKRIPFAVLLEMLSECEKFLLFDIKAHVEDKLCHYLSPSTVSKIYQFAKANNSPSLCKRALEVLFTQDSHKDVATCLNELKELIQDFDFFSDIKLEIQSMFPLACIKC